MQTKTKKRLKRLAVLTAATAVPLAAGYAIGTHRGNKKLRTMEGKFMTERVKRDISEHKLRIKHRQLEDKLDNAEEMFEMQMDAAQRNFDEVDAQKKGLLLVNRGLIMENGKQQDIIKEIYEEHQANKDLIGSAQERIAAAREQGLFEGSRMGWRDGYRHRQAEVNHYRQRSDAPTYRDSTRDEVDKKGRGRVKRFLKKAAMIAGPVVAVHLAANIGSHYGKRMGEQKAKEDYDRKLDVIQEKLNKRLHEDRKKAHRKGFLEHHIQSRNAVQTSYQAYQDGFYAGQDMGRKQTYLLAATNPHFWPAHQPQEFHQLGLYRRPNEADLLNEGMTRGSRNSARGLRKRFTEAPKPGGSLYTHAHRPYSTDSYKPGIADMAGMLFDGYSAYKRHQRRQQMKERLAKQMGVDVDEVEDMLANQEE